MYLFNKKKGRKVSILLNNKEVEIDSDFWDTLEEDDLLKEAIEEYVRNCDDIFVWVD